MFVHQNEMFLHQDLLSLYIYWNPLDRKIIFREEYSVNQDIIGNIYKECLCKNLRKLKKIGLKLRFSACKCYSVCVFSMDSLLIL